MDIKELKALIKMVTDTDITEFEMENAEEKVLIKRGSGQEIIQVQAPQSMLAPAPVPLAPQAVAAPGSAAAAPVAAEPVEEITGETINSPMVGTFYRKPSPDADPFTKEGDIVEAGQTVCLVEAMKMFNEIEAEFKCRIVEILKNDAAPVEFGDPLYRVERI